MLSHSVARAGFQDILGKHFREGMTAVKESLANVNKRLHPAPTLKKFQAPSRGGGDGHPEQYEGGSQHEDGCVPQFVVCPVFSPPPVSMVESVLTVILFILMQGILSNSVQGSMVPSSICTPTIIPSAKTKVVKKKHEI